MDHAIQHGIAEIDIARSHIDLGAQHARTITKFTRTHPLKQIEVFVDRPIPKRTVAPQFRQGATIGTHVVRAEIIDVGITDLNEVHRPGEKLLEII